MGSKYMKVLPVPASEGIAIYLLVYKEDASALQVGQKIPETLAGSYWLYGPAKELNKVQHKSSD